MSSVDLEKALGLIEELYDPERCYYDHHRYCQTHNLQDEPCPHERAKDLLKKHGWIE